MGTWSTCATGKLPVRHLSPPRQVYHRHVVICDSAIYESGVAVFWNWFFYFILVLYVICFAAVLFYCGFERALLNLQLWLLGFLTGKFSILPSSVFCLPPVKPMMHIKLFKIVLLFFLFWFVIGLSVVHFFVHDGPLSTFGFGSIPNCNPLSPFCLKNKKTTHFKSR